MHESLILDTCAVIWLMNGVELSDETVAAINKAAQTNQLFVSPVTAWEIALLARKGKIAMTMSALDWYQRVISMPGVHELDLNASVMVGSVELPGTLHKDPADRMLIATARSCNLSLVTRDEAILAYGQQGYVKTLAC